MATSVDKRILKHAYNLVIRWYKEGNPERLHHQHWVSLRKAVMEKYHNKINKKIRGTG